MIWWGRRAESQTPMRWYIRVALQRTVYNVSTVITYFSLISRNVQSSVRIRTVVTTYFFPTSWMYVITRLDSMSEYVLKSITFDITIHAAPEPIAERTGVNSSRIIIRWPTELETRVQGLAIAPWIIFIGGVPALRCRVKCSVHVYWCWCRKCVVCRVQSGKTLSTWNLSHIML